MLDDNPTTIALINRVTEITRSPLGWMVRGSLVEIDLDGVSTEIPVTVYVANISGAPVWTSHLAALENRRIRDLLAGDTEAGA